MEPRYDSLSEFEEALSEVPLFDFHTHLVEDQLGARGLNDLLLYHMLIAELHSAGCPQGNRLTEFPAVPGRAEVDTRLAQAVPYLEAIGNTSTSWMLRKILSDLFDWDRPLTPDNWRQLHEIVQVTSSDRSWHHSILDRSSIQRICTEYARRSREGPGLKRMCYSLEWGFFTRCQKGIYDTPLFELERCWGQKPESPLPVCTGPRPETAHRISTLDDLHEAIGWYVAEIPKDLVVSLATHFSADLSYEAVSPKEFERALKRRDKAGPEEQNIFAAFIQEAFLSELEIRCPGLVFQFSWGAEPFGDETLSRESSRVLHQIGEMMERHPQVRFACFSASAASEQGLCTQCRRLPNLWLAGHWWHQFFPSRIAETLEYRLEQVPQTRMLGFFSDAYCVEWTYAKSVLYKKQLAQVLWKKIQSGFFSKDQAMALAHTLLLDNPRSLFCG